MPVVDIILARHGQTDANSEDRMQGSTLNQPLNAVGERQAEALAAALKDARLGLIVTSALDRAIQTGRRVARYHPAAAVMQDARLNMTSWGALNGALYEEARGQLEAVFGRWAAGDFGAKVSGGESASDSQARVRAAFADILRAAHEGGHRRVFVCLHGGTTMVAMASLVDRDLRRMAAYTHTNCSFYHIRTELDAAQPVTDPAELRFEPVRLDVRDHLAAGAA
ncbi:hypothetical protein H4R18_000362 [Coemansia javaensis]|uniref:Histidine phosphatase family protein n=1 Tax=Coemansia javaensis TaxID=2761396 RepID=A0A9W8HNR6_9FUNG|nr:hypothetical protein H4R18_000362 [Coemansia javaensis]